MAALIRDRDVVSSGGHGVLINPARAGYLPIPLTKLPPSTFDGIPLFLRVRPDTKASDSVGVFMPFKSTEESLTETDCKDLLRNGIELVYIRMSDQHRFQEQSEMEMIRLASDPKLAISERANLIYETGVELINDLLSDPDIARFSHRLEAMSRSVATVVLNDPSAFTHLFTVSHHDFYTATHMINVATWMVPLAHALGHRDIDELTTICEAGLLHDIGKLYVPETVLNKQGALSEEDWWLLKRHPQVGHEHLQEYSGIDPLILRVSREHHERLDGSGYPDGLVDGQIHVVSKICAVVDSFDAMTAFRPFKRRTLSINEALDIIQSESPQKYDPTVVRAWINMVRATPTLSPDPGAQANARPAEGSGRERRQHHRFTFTAPARLVVLESSANGNFERRALQVVAHSISRSGLGVLSQTAAYPGHLVRVYLLARCWNREFLEAEIVRCRAYDDGWFEIGMRFTNIDGYDDPMNAIGEALAGG